ncbi:MAG: TolC family protein [Eubacteriales bacterium]
MKKILKFVMILTLISVVGFVTVYANEVINGVMSFLGDDIKISLTQATDKMLLDSPGAKIADINYLAAQDTALGYNESASSISALLKAYDAAGVFQTTVSTSDKNILRLRSGFATAQGIKNFEAEQNTLKQETYNKYFSVLQTNDAVKINTENVAIQERILKNTNKKFDLGMVSKQEVLQAELGILNAKNSLTKMEEASTMAKMGFNSFLGYDVMQKLVLTDTLKAADLPDLKLNASIEAAKANRNEIKAAKFALDMQNFLMIKTEVRYPSSSATYLKQKAAVLSAEQTLRQSITGIEIEMRGKYMDVLQKHSSIDNGIASVAKSKELLRLAELSFQVGMNTLTDVQQVQVLCQSDELALSQAILDYNLALNAYNIAITSGTFKAPL